jgi:hypothetical protein
MLRIIAVSFVLGFLAIGLLLLCSAFGLAIIAEVRDGARSASIAACSRSLNRDLHPTKQRPPSAPESS